MADPAARRESPTPLEAALERVGDRWSLLLVEALLGGPRRFNELAEAVPGIAPNILTDRLRRLERERIVVATPYQQRPPRMSYALTADGRDLASALRLAGRLGRAHGPAAPRPHAEPMRHGSCGTPARGALVLPDLRDRRSRSTTRRRRARPAIASDPRSGPSTRSPAGYTRPDGRRALGTRDAGPRSPGRRRPPPRRDRAPSTLPPSLQGLPPRSVPETAPTPLQQHYVLLSVPVLICGAIAITALELGAPLGSPLVKLCVLIAAPLLLVTTADAVAPDLALGLGVDAGRPRQGPLPARLGRGQPDRPGRARRGRARGHRWRDATDGRVRARSGRPSTDLPSGGGVPPGWPPR